MKKLFILGHLIPLFIGGTIYILFRGSSLKMTSWFNNLGLGQIIDEYRKGTIPFGNNLAGWILFSLPDGLWVFSYVSLMLVIWHKSISKYSVFWIFLIPVIAICSEFGQLFGLVPGVFDLMDLLSYFTGIVLPFILYKNSITSKFQTL